MNIDVKILKKILSIQTQEHIRKIIYHDQIGFILEIQGWRIMGKLIAAGNPTAVAFK